MNSNNMNDDIDKVTLQWWIDHAKHLEAQNKELTASNPYPSLWREACESFAKAFELDGFGDVRSVNIVKATEAYRAYEEASRGNR